MNLKKTALAMFVVATLLVVSAASAFPLTTDSTEVKKALDYLNSSQLDNGSFGDAAASYYSDLTPFAIMAIKAANQDPNSWKKNGTSPVDFLLNQSIPALTNSSVPTYYAVNILALVAAGKDPQSAAGRNLTDELIQKENPDGSFNGTAWITDNEWSILALVAAGYKDTDYVKNATEYLKSQQLADGGFGAWCPGATDSCPDETALGIMAFLAAGVDKSSSNVQNAVARLKTFQVNSGGFDPGYGTNVDTDAWATQAIIALGNDFSDWSKSHFAITTSASSYTATPQSSYSLAVSIANNGNNHSFDNMLAYQDSGGGFIYFKPVQDTSYVIMAMLGKPFPINGTSYTQSESINAGKNQTFFGALTQTLGWDFTVTGNSSRIDTANSADMTFAFSVPANSSGTQNNITFTVNALLDNAVKTKAITISSQAPPNNPGGTPSSPSSGGGGGGGGSTSTPKPKEEKKEEPKKEPAPAASVESSTPAQKETAPQPAVSAAPQAAANTGGPTGFSIFNKKATVAAAVAGAGILGLLFVLWKKAALSSTVSV